MRRLMAVLATAIAILAASTAVNLSPAAGATRSSDTSSVSAAAAPSFSAVFTRLPKAPAPIADGRWIPLNSPMTATSQYDCYYIARLPAYHIDFRCTVITGAIRLWADCAGWGRYYDPYTYHAFGHYNVRVSCYPYTATNFGVEQVL